MLKSLGVLFLVALTACRPPAMPGLATASPLPPTDAAVLEAVLSYFRGDEAVASRSLTTRWRWERPDPQYPLMLVTDYPEADQAYPVSWLQQLHARRLVDGLCGERLSLDCSMSENRISRFLRLDRPERRPDRLLHVYAQLHEANYELCGTREWRLGGGSMSLYLSQAQEGWQVERIEMNPVDESTCERS